MTTLKPRLLGLAATLGIIAVIVGVPVLLVAIHAVPSAESFSWNVLRSPDDGTLALAVITVVAWLAWLVIAAAFTVEAFARLRGISVPRVPGLAMPQLAVGRAVAVASLLFVAAPLAGHVASAPASPVATRPVSEIKAPASPLPTPAPAPATGQAPSPLEVDTLEADTIGYVTKRGDSLWRIAEEHLGDGRRYAEVVALNTDVLHGQPDFIPVGLALRLPVTQRPAGAPDTARSPVHVVEPGDTLSEIAADELGDPQRFPELFDASRDTVQPDGAQLTDPDLIRPGWHITLPERSVPARAEGDRGDGERRQDDSGSSRAADRPRPRPAEARPAPTVESPVASPDVLSADEGGAPVPGWVLPGLTGGGAMLAGALLLVVRAHRRTQRRQRRPGHVIALPPPDLLPVEKTLQATGTPIVGRIEKVDDLLRHLRLTATEVPALNALELTPTSVVLHLATSSDLPPPWHGTQRRWEVPLDAEVPVKPDEPAPYPLLVAVGSSDDGHVWLVNLEQLRSVAATGDPAHAEAFGRHLAAELALNPWSVRVDIIAVGIGHELDSLSPRLTHHAPDDDGALCKLEDYLAGDNRIDGPDPEIFHAVVTTTGEPSAVARVVGLIDRHPWRAGTAVVTLRDPAPDGATAFHFDTGGRLHIPSLELDLRGCGLAADEATACAAIVELTRDAENEPIPALDAEHGLDALTDRSGAIRTELTEPRPPRPTDPAGPDSVLPLASTDYRAEAATTDSDVETLAPLTPPETRRRVRDADPLLDADLAAWFDPTTRVPKLTLLGPVNALAHGDTRAVATRKAYFVELLAYLCLHPGGVTSDQLVTDFAITKNRTYVDLRHLRSWLGTDPRTGTEHLPRLKASRGTRSRDESTYSVDGVLSDVDLFRRLRARGQADGADGIADLARALRLVTGEPFSRLRETGWSWLLEGERLDHVMTCSVVDVAHIVTTHALAVGDLDLATRAAETAYGAAPYDDVSCLDMLRVAAASGHLEIAERHLVDGIFNRSDDDDGPIDLPPRTAQIVKERGWERGTRPTKR